MGRIRTQPQALSFYQLVAYLFVWLTVSVKGFDLFPKTTRRSKWSSRLCGEASSSNGNLFGSIRPISSSSIDSFESIVQSRYSCKKFQRYDNNTTAVGPSPSDPLVVQNALQCLDIARRTPTAFNTQPYKVVVVHSVEQKAALSKYCLGPNEKRVLDADCTVVFLADRQITRTFRRHSQLHEAPSTRLRRLQMQFYIAIFSSGLPLPRFLASPLTFLIRTMFGIVHTVTSRFYPLPSLASAETWSSKQAMMVAMIYMLACTARGLATIPMEGFNARGLRSVIRAPGRYAIPLIVCTGKPYSNERKRKQVDDRYPLGEMVFSDTFGKGLALN